MGPSRQQARRRQLGVGMVIGLLVAVAAGGSIGAGMTSLATSALITVAAPFTPDIEPFDDLAATTTITAADGTVLDELDRGEHREPVDLDALPDHVRHAVLAAEDHDFYTHAGIDLDALGRAVVKTATGNVQGGSTITQQLAKLNYAGSDRSIFRKAREVMYAVALEHELTKDELLEQYLNQVYFGNGAHGIATAAATYFGVDATELTAAQAATLAGKIRSPEGLDAEKDPDALQERRDQVLGLMAEHGWLEPEDLDRAVAEPLGIVDRADDEEADTALAPYFVELVKKEALALDELGGSVEARRRQLLTGGLTIETTLDVAAQTAAEEVVTSYLPDPEDPSAGVVTVEPNDGAIRILVGGKDFANQQFDVTTQSERQPGSAFKPFVYLGAIGAGIHPDSQVPGDSPTTFDWKGEPYEVHNYDDRSYGATIPVREGLIRSVNTAFVELGLEISPDQVVRTAHQAGITSEINPVPAVALGGISPGVSPLQMANAYATFAAAGVRSQPYAIARITDRGSEVIYENTPDTERQFPKEEVGVLNAGLRDVVRHGTGGGAAFGRDVAGKTGTTTDNRDAWFVGFTPQRATAVWVGDLDNEPVPGLTGGSAPAAIFARVMLAAHENLEPASIYTASPEELSLRMLTPPTTRETTSSSDQSSTSSSSTSSSTTEPDEETTTTSEETTTTEEPTTTTEQQPTDEGTSGETTTTTGPS